MIRRLGFASLTIIGMLMAACGSQGHGADHATSLITGRVAAGPVSPGARPGAPRTRAVQGATVEALRGNQVIASARSDGAGRFEFRLQPGTYLIRARSDKYLAKETSKVVSVRKGEKVTVDLVLATGIS